jgi:phosphoserine phosphatase
VSYRQGACVIDLDGFLLEDIWQTMLDTFHIPFEREPGPLHLDEAKRLVGLLAGLPVRALTRVAAQAEASTHVSTCIEHAHEQGMSTVLISDAPRPIVDALTQRLGAQGTASLETEIRAGRLTGELTDVAWLGSCGQVVCAMQVVRSAHGQYGRRVQLVGASPRCNCSPSIPPRAFLRPIAVEV